MALLKCVWIKPPPVVVYFFSTAEEQGHRLIDRLARKHSRRLDFGQGRARESERGGEREDRATTLGFSHFSTLATNQQRQAVSDGVGPESANLRWDNDSAIIPVAAPRVAITLQPDGWEQKLLVRDQVGDVLGIVWCKKDNKKQLWHIGGDAWTVCFLCRHSCKYNDAWPACRAFQ